MAVLPTPGGDTDNWGIDLNIWLQVQHNADGTHSFFLNNPVTPNQGGTGVASPTAHTVPVAEGASNFSFILPSTGSYGFISQGLTSDPNFVNLQDSLQLNTPLSVGSGGLGISSAAAHGVPIATGGGAFRILLPSTASYAFKSDGSAFDPNYGIISVGGGGSGHSVMPANAVVLSNVTNPFNFAIPTTPGLPLVAQAQGSAPIFSNILQGTSALPITIAAGNLNFSSTGQRITGDFSNATGANRTAFQDKTARSSTRLMVFPNGPDTGAGALAGEVNVFGVPASTVFDPANATVLSMGAAGPGSQTYLNSTVTGTGTQRSLNLQVAGTTYLTIPTTGGVQVNSGNLGVNGPPQANVGIYSPGTVNASGGVAKNAYLVSTLVAQVNNDALYGLEVFPQINTNAKTGVAAYGIIVDSITGAPTNYGVYINAPSGGTTNIGLYNAGTTVLGNKITTYNSVPTAGIGVPAINGLDSRTGLTSADGAATTLYTTIAANNIFRVSADIFATAAVTGTATFTIAWTENGTAQSMAVTSTAINTLGTASNIIRPDNATTITSKLTGVFTGTFTVAALVEQLA